MPVQDELKLEASAVERLSELKNEPEWMKERRLAAWQTYEKLPSPKWDRTDISQLDLNAVSPYAAGALTEAELPDRLAAALSRRPSGGGIVLQHNSIAQVGALPDELAAEGVIFTDMETAVREHEELVRPLFMTEAVRADEDKLVALHAALWSGGCFLYVPKGVDVEVPFEFALWADAPSAGIFPHVLIVAERESRLRFVESGSSRAVSEGGNPVCIGVTEIFARDGSQVQFAGIQNWETDMYNFVVRRAVQGRDSVVEWVQGEVGSKLSRSGATSLLEGDGSRANSIGLYFGAGSQHLDTGTTMRHIGRSTEGYMETKGALKGRARSVYRGLTDIKSGARDSQAYQHANALLLSSRARNDAIPGLEIGEDSVQAGHAATTGEVDEEQLFYLMSRGLTRQEGLELIVNGFFAPVLDAIPLEGVRDELQGLIDRKMAS